MSILLAEKTSEGIRAAVVEDGKLLAWKAEKATTSIQEGQIYLGVADRVIKSINALFVKLTSNDYGFLPIESGKPVPSSGTRLLVQVKRPPNNAKKAFLTTDISFEGDTCIFLPFGNHVSVSKRVEETESRHTLKQLGNTIRKPGTGLIMRSSALVADIEIVKGQLEKLQRDFETIQSKSRTAHAPCLLRTGDNPLEALLHEEAAHLESILTNATEIIPETSITIKTSEHPFLLYNVDAALTKAKKRTVLLKSGTTLVIDRCEAMTVIDVNSAMATKGRSITETAEKINLEACKEIARLLRLLSIGGMILVDFIDLPDNDARERLISYMRECLHRDPTKTVVIDITPLGIMEMTRSRSQTPMEQLEDDPCPLCGGSGIHFLTTEEIQSDV